MRFNAIAVALLVCAAGCRRPSYQVIARVPAYQLRFPNGREIPLTDVLRDYNGFERGRAAIDLRPQMQLLIENAYYQRGFSRKGLQGYLGTEVARYEVARRSLRLLAFVPLKGRPAADLPVQNLISPAQLKFRYYRLYFEILFDRKTEAHGSLLLAARSMKDLDRLSGQLNDPQKLCAALPGQCTIFPEACSVSVEMSIVVNEKRQFITWGSLLSSVVPPDPRQLRVLRLFHGRPVPVQIDLSDVNQLRLPLLPGDRLSWR